MSTSALPSSTDSPAQVAHYIHGIYDTVKNKLQPESVDGRFFALTSPKSADQVISYNPETQKFDNLTLENGLYTAARLTYYIAVPFFATYFAWYSVGCVVVTGVLAAIAEFRGDHEDCKDLTTIGMTHAAYAIYNLAISYLGAATLLYIPVVAALYAVKPDWVMKAHNYMHTHRDPRAERDETIEHKLADLIKEEKLAQPAPSDDDTSPAAPKSEILVASETYQHAFKAYRAKQSDVKKKGIIEDIIPGYIKHFMDTVMVRKVEEAAAPAPQETRWQLLKRAITFTRHPNHKHSLSKS